jgi:hypothetical protein
VDWPPAVLGTDIRKKLWETVERLAHIVQVELATAHWRTAQVSDLPNNHGKNIPTKIKIESARVKQKSPNCRGFLFLTLDRYKPR